MLRLMSVYETLDAARQTRSTSARTGTVQWSRYLVGAKTPGCR